MSNPIRVSTPSQAVASPRPSVSSPASTSRDFRQLLRSPTNPSGPETVRQNVTRNVASIERGRKTLDRLIASAPSLPQEQLIVLQAQVYRYSQEVELVTRMAERASSGLQKLLSSQQ